MGLLARLSGQEAPQQQERDREVQAAYDDWYDSVEPVTDDEVRPAGTSLYSVEELDQLDKPDYVPEWRKRRAEAVARDGYVAEHDTTGAVWL